VFLLNLRRANFFEFERYRNVTCMLHELGLPSIAMCGERSRWSWVACLNSIIVVLFAGDPYAH